MVFFFIPQKLKVPYPGKKISTSINDWENNAAYWEKSKQGEMLSDKCDSFHTVSSWWVLGHTAQPQGNFTIYTLTNVWKQY